MRKENYLKCLYFGQIVMQWLRDHPEFMENNLYIGGDSYSGTPIPRIVQAILYGNLC